MKKLLICAAIVCGLSATPTALVRAKNQRKQPVKQLWDYAVADAATATAPGITMGKFWCRFPSKRRF